MSLPFELVKRKIFVKSECSTDSKFGCSPFSRSVDELLDSGVVCLNKPKGPSSHMCAEYVKKILGLKKSGHGGTLDPGVTGVLPVTLGRATRVVKTLLLAGKEYVCIMHLHDDVDEVKIRDVAKSFVGKIKQLPPVKSAVVRRVRERQIYYLDVLEVSGRDVLFRVGCEAGTYVRKLCHDWGLALGSSGHMSELIRTKSGPFSDSELVSLQDLEDAVHYWKVEGNDKFLRHCIKPMEFAIRHLPRIWVQDSAVDSLCHGATLHLPGVVKFESEIKKGDVVSVLTLKDELVGFGVCEMSSEMMNGFEKGVVVRFDAVLMKPSTYPGRKDIVDG